MHNTRFLIILFCICVTPFSASFLVGGQRSGMGNQETNPRLRHSGPSAASDTDLQNEDPGRPADKRPSENGDAPLNPLEQVLADTGFNFSFLLNYGVHFMAAVNPELSAQLLNKYDFLTGGEDFFTPEIAPYFLAPLMELKLIGFLAAMGRPYRLKYLWNRLMFTGAISCFHYLSMNFESLEM